MAKRAVQMRVVDVALPAHRGARFLEIHPHHDQQVGGQRIGLLLELPRIFHRLLMVMDGTRTDHHDQPIILALQHP